MDNNNKQNKNGMPNRTAIIITLVAALVIWYMFSLLSQQVKESTNIEVTYDKFLSMVDNGEIKSITFKQDKIEFVPKEQPNKAFDISYLTAFLVS
jgi:cell division protease FtsH